MKLTPQALALMAALSAGVAGAAATGTVANTQITNQATATYTDPSAPASTLTSNSNTVYTVVLPKPDYDIVFKNTTPTDGGTQNAIATTTKVLTGTAGSSFNTVYTVVNNGNVTLSVNLAPNVTGSSSAATDVKYYLADASGNPTGGAITSVSIDPTVNSGLVDIVQVVSVPGGATTSNTYGASPQGSVVGTGTAATQNGYASGTTYYENSVTSATHTDYQFTAIKLYALDNNPNPPTTPTTPVTPGGTVYTPPTMSTVDVPTLPAGNTDTTKNTPPTTTAGDPTYPSPSGYADPNNASTPIVPNVSGDNQIAYPKADPDNTDPANAVGNTNSTAGTADSVTFVNTITNTGSAPDRVQLFPTAAVTATGTLNLGYTYDSATATFTYPDGVTKVQFLNPDGTPIAKGADSLFPVFNLAPGATAYYQTKITYPDTTDSASTPAVVTQIGADSLNDSDVISNASTTNTIYPAAAQFGDTTAALGTVPNPAPVQTVTPYGDYPAGRTGSPDSTDSTAVFPMDVVNVGQYSDSFKLSGTVNFGGTIVNVKYYDASGNLLPTDSGGNYITNVAAAGSELKVFAVVDVPLGTATGSYTVTQNAVGSYSTIPMSDLNDVITVAKPGAVNVAKFVAQTGASGATVNGLSSGAGYVLADSASPTTAKPTDTISYKIMAKNTYPVGIASFLLSDTTPINTNFSTASVSSDNVALTNLKVLYKVSGSWTATTPADPTTVTAVAVDINGDGLLNASDVLPSNTTLTLNMTVTVK